MVSRRTNVLGAAVALALLQSGPASAQQSGAAQVGTQTAPQRLDEIVVEGYRIRGYQTDTSNAGGKLDVPLIETSNTVSVLTRDFIEDVQAQTLTEALRFVGNVNPGYFGRRGFDDFVIRGFIQSDSVLRDGLREDSFSAREPYGTERIEVFKGPASVAYGQTAPGGVINLVTKRPYVDNQGQLEASANNYGLRRVGLDLSRRLDDDGKWLARGVAVVMEREDPIDFVDGDRIYVAPTLSWRPTDATSLTLFASYQDDNFIRANPIPGPGSLLPNPNGRFPLTRYIGEKDWEGKGYQVEQWVGGYEFRHAFNETWQFRQNTRYYKYDVDGRAHYSGGLQAANQRILNRFADRVLADSKALSLDNQLIGRFQGDNVEHTFLVGVDYFGQEFERLTQEYDAAPLDIYNPVYGRAPVATPEFDYFQQTEVDQYGIYALEQIKLNERWVFSLGGRFDKSKDSSIQDFERPFDDPPAKAEDEAFTYKVGVLYLSPTGLAPYVSYTTSYLPILDTFARDGSRFEPEEGSQIEVGVKYEPPGRRLLATLSWFQIDRKNMVTTDPLDDNFSIAEGERRHRGVELEVAGQLAPGLDLFASWGYVDAAITKSFDGDAGKRPRHVPRNNGSLWLTYAFPQAGPLQGFEVNGGVRYVGDRAGDFGNNFLVPSYTVFDLGANYTRGPWRFALNVQNVGDKDYFAGALTRNIVMVGDPRTVVGSLHYNF